MMDTGLVLGFARVNTDIKRDLSIEEISHTGHRFSMLIREG